MIGITHLKIIIMMGHCADEILTLEVVFSIDLANKLKCPFSAAKYPCGVLLRKNETCWQMFGRVAQ